MDHRLGFKSKTPYGVLIHRDGQGGSNKRPKRIDRPHTPPEIMTRQASLDEMQLICQRMVGGRPPTEPLAPGTAAHRDFHAQALLSLGNPTPMTQPTTVTGGPAHSRHVPSCDQASMLAASLLPLIHMRPMAVTHGLYMPQPLAQYFQARQLFRTLSRFPPVQPMQDPAFRRVVPVREPAPPRVNAPPISLACSTDKKVLSMFQVFLRMHIEVFCAGDQDIMSPMRGRNKKIHLGQVGIRCRHCAHIPPNYRTKGSTYFPATTIGFYQAGQNMSSTHLQCGLCSEMPELTRQHFATLLGTKTTKSSSSSGRAYWQHCAKAMGLVDTDHGIFPTHAVPPGVVVLGDAIPN